MLEAFAALRRLDTLLPSVLGSVVSAWTPEVDRTMRSAPAQAALGRAVSNVPSAQAPALADALCGTLELAVSTNALKPLGTIARVCATVLCALRAEPQQAVAGAAAVQRVISACQALVNKVAERGEAEGRRSAMSCGDACLPLLQLQAGALHLYSAFTAHDPALDEVPPVLVFPTILLRHVPLWSSSASPACAGRRCPVCSLQTLAAAAQREAAELETPLAKLYQIAAAAAGRVQDAVAGTGGMQAVDAAAGGAACLAWLTKCLHDNHIRSTHSLSCTTSHQHVAVPQQLLTAASDIAGLALLRGLQTVCLDSCVAHQVNLEGAVKSEIQAGVVVPLLRCVEDWLPHADDELQKEVVRSCMLVTADVSVAQQLHSQGLQALASLPARFTCSKSFLSGSVASKGWPAAFASVARRLQQRVSASVGAAVAAGCLKSCDAAEHILQQAACVTKPSQDQSVLLQLMRQTADMLSDHKRVQLHLNLIPGGGKRPRAAPQGDSTEVVDVMRCTENLLFLVQGMDIEELAAFSKKRKWGLLARSLIAVLSSMLAVCVFLQGNESSEATRLQSVTLLGPMKQLSKAVARVNPGDDGWVVSAELISMVTSCTSAAVWTGCQNVMNASSELMQNVAAVALAQGECQGLHTACQGAYQRLQGVLSGTRGAELREGTPRSVLVKERKRKRQMRENASIQVQSSSGTLSALVLLDSVAAAALLHYQAGSLEDGSGSSNILQCMWDFCNSVERACSDCVSRVSNKSEGFGSVADSKLLFSLRARAACCKLAAKHTPDAQQKVIDCVQVRLISCVQVCSCGVAGAVLVRRRPCVQQTC